MTELFDQPISTLQEWTRGDRITARKLNETVRAVNRVTQAGVAPIARIEDPVEPIPAAALEVRWFTYTESIAEGPNTLRLRVPEDEDPSGFVEVAKAPELQLRTWNGFDVGHYGRWFYVPQPTFPVGFLKRIATTGPGTFDLDQETQVITPDYVDGDRILAVKMDTGIVDHRDEPVEWQDLNLKGRAWTKTDD